MTGMEILTVASLVVGVATPCGSLVYFLGSVKTRLQNIEKNQCKCLALREANERDLHEKTNANAKDIARIKGRMNGAGHG